MKEKDACKKALFERASCWVRDFLLPIFDGLIEKLEQKGYQASKSRETDQSLTLAFSKGGKKFEYKILWVARPPSSGWPIGHIDLNFSYSIDNLHYDWPPFRDKKDEYDIEDIDGEEVRKHFYRIFRLWLQHT